MELTCVEDEIIKLFILSNPYPSYEEIEDLQDRRIDLDSEYGLYNHNLCKNVYENLYKENCKIFVEKWIKTVTDSSGGGIFTLRCNAETIRLFSPISKCKIPEVIEKFKEIYDYVVNIK
jgi:hypothetical protein